MAGTTPLEGPEGRAPEGRVVGNGLLEYPHSAGLVRVLDSIHEGVVVIDRDTRIVYANPAYTRILRVPVKRILGKRMAEIEPEAKINRVVVDGVPVREEEAFVKTLKKTVVVNIEPILAGGKVIGAVSVFRDVTEVLELTRKLREARMLADHLRDELNRNVALPDPFKSIIGSNGKLRQALSLASRVAPTNATVLIIGENGVGKELVARAIHLSSTRASKPLIRIDCTAIPETLLESELFGYEEGAFTGARKGGKPGKIEIASGGTIFFDEIGEMSLSMQAKVLRVLEAREFERVGGTTTLKVDARILAATNRDLDAMVKQGKFREDLYYRLCVVPVIIPPLRERPDDIPALATAFVEEFNHVYSKGLRLSREVVNRLVQYCWPGNVRELRNTIEHAVLICEGDTLLESHLPAYMMGPRHTGGQGEERRDGRAGRDEAAAARPVTRGKALKALVSEIEETAVREALEQANGNVSAAMQYLGVSRRTFYKKMSKFGLEPGQFRGPKALK
ncbi:MAG: sigma 54-interacting transcriptional regulator [Firmicutes bacterium]|nr:sigma 54-interacting transcriptional regulator [Bacillota bacterium]